MWHFATHFGKPWVWVCDILYDERLRVLAKGHTHPSYLCLQLSLITQDFPTRDQSHDGLYITPCSMKRSPWLRCDPLCWKNYQKRNFMVTWYRHYIFVMRSKMLFSFPSFYGGSTYQRCDMGGPCGSKWMCQKHQYINTAEGVKLDRAHEDHTF